MTDFEHLSRTELVEAMREGRLSRDHAGRILFDRAARHLRSLETKAKREELAAANAKARERSTS